MKKLYLKNEILVETSKKKLVFLFILFFSTFFNLILGSMVFYVYFNIKNDLNFKKPENIMLLNKQINIDYTNEYVKEEMKNLILIKSSILENYYKNIYFKGIDKLVYKEYKNFKQILKKSKYFKIVKIKKISGMSIPYKQKSDSLKSESKVFFSTIRKYKILIKVKNKKNVFYNLFISIDSTGKIVNINYKEDKNEEIIRILQKKIKYITKSNIKKYFHQNLLFEKESISFYFQKIKKLEPISIEIDKKNKKITQLYKLNNNQIYKFIFMLKDNKLYLDKVKKGK